MAARDAQATERDESSRYRVSVNESSLATPRKEPTAIRVLDLFDDSRCAASASRGVS
jgi:hypothetical protein